MTLSLPWSGLESSTHLNGGALQTLLTDPEVSGGLPVCPRMPRKARPVAGITARDCPGDTPRHSARHSRSLHRKVWPWPLLVYPLMSANVPTERHRCPEMARDIMGRVMEVMGMTRDIPVARPGGRLRFAPASKSAVLPICRTRCGHSSYRTLQTKKATTSGLLCLERVMGIEPTLAAWEAAVLPLNYTRVLPYQRFPSLVMGMTRDIRVARPSGAPTLRFGVQIGSPADLSSPTLAAWEAAVLPLNYTRRIFWC